MYIELSTHPHEVSLYIEEELIFPIAIEKAVFCLAMKTHAANVEGAAFALHLDQLMGVDIFNAFPQ